MRHVDAHGVKVRMTDIGVIQTDMIHVMLDVAEISIDWFYFKMSLQLAYSNVKGS